MSPPASLPREVLKTLAAVRRRRRALAVLQALCWTLAALSLGAGILLIASFDGAAPSWARVGARVWIGAAVVVPILLLVVPAWRRTSSWLAVARAVDDRVPATQDRLLTAVDLARALDAHALAEDPETLRLARAQLTSSSDAAEHVVPEQILPVTGLHGSTLLGPGLATLVLCALILSPDRLDGPLQALFGPIVVAETDADEPVGDLPVTLTLRNVNIKLVPPAYSGREELILEGTTGDFQALPGTRVLLDADTSGGGKGAQIILGNPDGYDFPLPADIDGKELEADFLTGNGESYRIEVSRGLGREPLRSRTFFIERLPDHFPELEVLAPAGQLTLNGAETVPLQVRADDDFALTRLERVVMQGRTELSRVSVADVNGKASHEQLIRWGPAELEGKGGELSIFLEAWDNDTVNGPKATRSRPVEIYVPTARDLHRKVLALKEQLGTAALDLLADLLVVNAQGTSLDARDEILEAHDRQQLLASEFFRVGSDLLAAMSSDELELGSSFAGIQQILTNFDTRWTVVVETVETTFRKHKHPRVHRVTVMDLVRERDAAIEELERIVLDLEAFVDLHRGDQLRGDLADLGNQFADMQDLLRRAQDGEMVDQDLQKQMDELEKRMQELAQKLAERSTGPDDGFMNKMPNEMSKDAMAEVRELLAQGKFDEAMEKLRQMDEALSGMEKQLDTEAGEMAGGQAAEQVDAELSAAIERARELEKQQEAVLEQMGELTERFGDQGMTEQERAALVQDMAELREKIDQIEDPDAGPFVRPGVRRTAWRASQEVSQMAEAFGEQRMDDAASFGRETQELMKEAAQELAADARTDSGAKPARDAARSAAKLAGSIAERLEQAQGRQRAQRREAQKAGQQAGRQQGQVAQGVGELGQQMEKMGGSAFNPARGQENLKNAEDLMRRAQSRAGDGDPGRAESAGKDGLSQLRQFRQSMEEARESLREGGKPGGKPMMAGGAGGNSPDRRDSQQGDGESGGPVELTDPDEFVGPEAFRALIQEGAQADAPDRYKPLNGTYYEELVR